VRKRSREIDLASFDTDKIPNGFLQVYDAAFAPLVDEPLALLELGVRSGGSLQLWRDYFPQARVVGIDANLPAADLSAERLRFYQGKQEDKDFLSSVAAEAAPDGFDIIIDDASHIAAPTRTCFWHLFENHLKPGGLYAIEDWGTGYWEAWPDGHAFSADEPHHHGMVGFIKELIDEQGAHDLSRGWYTETWTRSSRFSSVLTTASLVIVTKKELQDPYSIPRNRQ
jgi:SAM-dependent methyltransferase